MFEEVLNYYDKNKRDLPWRRNRNPYSIWISEIMCQQTRVDTVIPYFNRFMEAFPTIHELANCNDEKLMKLWQGLGYYSRARNLKKAAQVIEEKYSGQFPKDYDSLESLPGIGNYTACAILSMAYDLPYVSIDGNFLRVFSRYYEDGSDIALDVTKKSLNEKLLSCLPERSGDFNQAIMDIGATICLPNEQPHCEKCPLKEKCQACIHESYLNYPVNSKNTKVTDYDYTLFIIKAGE